MQLNLFFPKITNLSNISGWLCNNTKCPVKSTGLSLFLNRINQTYNSNVVYSQSSLNQNTQTIGNINKHKTKAQKKQKTENKLSDSYYSSKLRSNQFAELLRTL